MNQLCLLMVTLKFHINQKSVYELYKLNTVGNIMKVQDLIAQLQKMVSENPEVSDYEVYNPISLESEMKISNIYFGNKNGNEDELNFSTLITKDLTEAKNHAVDDAVVVIIGNIE